MYKKYKLILAGTSKKAKVNITEHNIKNKQQVQMKTQLLKCIRMLLSVLFIHIESENKHTHIQSEEIKSDIGS